MQKWYTNKVLLNTLILIMVVAFMAYVFRPSPQIKQLGLIVFLVVGTMVMIRGVVKITMGMRKTGR